MADADEIIKRLTETAERVRQVNEAASKEKRIRDVGEVDQASPTTSGIQTQQQSPLQGEG